MFNLYTDLFIAAGDDVSSFLRFGKGGASIPVAIFRLLGLIFKALISVETYNNRMITALLPVNHQIA